MDMKPTPCGPLISLVIPVFNEEAVLDMLFVRLDTLLPKLGSKVEIILIDDGSQDTSAQMICAKTLLDPRYRYVGLSRNFGHQIAITTGLHLAAGDAVIVMDADLQDPPELATELLAQWRAGFDIVHARRRSRSGETGFKKHTAMLFYRLLQAISNVEIPVDVGDFRLLDRRVVETFKAMPEQDRYVRGMFSWMGYRQTIIDYDRDERAAGETKYSLFRMMKLALNGVTGFSEAPLRLALWMGSLVSVGSLLYACVVIVGALTGAHMVSGWASLAVLTSLLSGINLLMVGFVGLYVGQIHRETKRRPLYVITRDTGMPFDAEKAKLLHDMAAVTAELR